MSQPFISPYKDNFPIIIDVGLKTELNKTKQPKKQLLEQFLSTNMLLYKMHKSTSIVGSLLTTKKLNPSREWDAKGGESGLGMATPRGHHSGNHPPGLRWMHQSVLVKSGVG